MICVLVASVFILLPCALSLAAAHLVLVRVAPEAMCFSSVRKFESQRAAAGRETRSEQLSVDQNPLKPFKAKTSIGRSDSLSPSRT